MIEIVQLNVYPVKSCRGTSLREATLVELFREAVAEPAGTVAA